MASSASSSSAPSSSVAGPTGLHFKPAKADKDVGRNLTLRQKVEIFDLLDRFQKGEKLVLDGKVVKYEYEIGIPYGVKKAEVSRLKGLSNEAKNKIRKDAKDRESGIPGNRTRVQVCCFCFACYVFFLLFLFHLSRLDISNLLIALCFISLLHCVRIICPLLLPL